MSGNRSFQLFAVAAALAALGGCAGAGSVSGVAPERAPQGEAMRTLPDIVDKKKVTPVVFFADATANAIYGYVQAGKNQTAFETLSGNGLNQPEGLAADPAGDLYVANSVANNILMFPPGGTTVSKTFTGAGPNPYTVAACANGTILAGNVGSGSTNGSVTLYANGSTSPTGTITEAYFNEVWGVACDAQSNIYVSYYNVSQSNSGGVNEYDSAGKHGKVLPMTTQTPGEVKIDKAGDVVLADLGAGQILYFHKTSGIPFRTLPAIALYMAFDQRDANIWISDTCQANCPGDLQRITAKAGHVTDDIKGASTRTGVATIPPD